MCVRIQNANLLNLISYQKDTKRIDGYKPIHSLELHGVGIIQTDASQLQPLPKSFFEIPLEDSTLYHYDNAKFSILTHRGAYTIEFTR